jgi:ribA/ribD-fused uncharacterized protein
MTDQLTPPGDGAWTLEQLLAAERSDYRLKFLLFWGHTPSPSGQIGPHVFSQWYPHEFTSDGIRYATAEHFMMAEKARLFGDEHHLDLILAAATPGEAKKLGRHVQGFQDDAWNQHRLDIVARGSVAKFSSNESMRDYLMGTGDRVLVEASPRDRIWGIGMGKNNPSAERPSQWRGKNLLGFALMQARAELRRH